MAITVECPGGHTLRVRNEYAGKSGYCPRCKARLTVPDPRPLSDDEILAIMGGPNLSEPEPDDSSESVFDHPVPPADASAVSLLGSSKVQGHKVCPGCCHLSSFSFSVCPKCGTPLIQRTEEPDEATVSAAVQATAETR